MGRTVGSDVVEQVSTDRNSAWAGTETVSIVHELGPDLSSETARRTIVIEPSESPVSLHIQSQVQSSTAKRFLSAAYQSTIRRREAKKLLEKLRKIAASAPREDFHMLTFPFLEQLRSAIGKLQISRTEGNSREILRQIRDTLLNEGWKRYQEAPVIATVDQILTDLERKDEITPEHVEDCSSRLLEFEMSPVELFMFEDYDEEDTH